MELFTFHGNDFHISRREVTETGNEALWEAAAHTNRVQHKLLQERQGQSFSGMNCGILGMTLDMICSILLVECEKMVMWTL